MISERSARLIERLTPSVVRIAAVAVFVAWLPVLVVIGAAAAVCIVVDRFLLGD